MSTSAPPPTEPGPGPARGRFERSGSDRVVAGVGGGLARYFGIDPLLVRLALVGLALLGGVGVVLYAGAWAFVPADGQPAPASRRGWGLVAVVVVALLAAPLVLGGAFALGALLIPLAFLALLGVATWWAVSGRRPGREPRTLLLAALFGLLVFGALHVLFFGAGWIAAEGGDGWIAGLVIAAGVALIAGAFVRRVRWLVLPALTVALAAGFVAAADLEFEGGYGERTYRPGDVAAIQDRYELAVGELTLDLRGADLPAGDTPVRLDIGVGAAEVLVDRDVCVVTRADLGVGGVSLFDRDSGGVDVQWRDEPRAPAGTPRLVLDADIGFGALDVAHDEALLGFDDDDWDEWDDERRGVTPADEPGNLACEDGAERAAVR
jgi:phage shock protein PspC (stress-responsive transcriptional regulator)